MAEPKKRSMSVQREASTKLHMADDEGLAADIPVRIADSEYDHDDSANDGDEDPNEYNIDDSDEVQGGPDEGRSDDGKAQDDRTPPHLVHDSAASVQKIRSNGIKTRFQLLNLIMQVAQDFLKGAEKKPENRARMQEIADVSERLRPSYREIYDLIEKHNSSSFESLHDVLAGAFLIGLASDRVGLSVTDAKKLAWSIFAANARKYSQSSAANRAVKFDRIVKDVIPMAFQRHEILKKLSNSDQSADLLKPFVVELVWMAAKEDDPAARKEDSEKKIGRNTIRQAMKRITGGKKGGIRRDSPEIREILERAPPV